MTYLALLSIASLAALAGCIWLLRQVVKASHWDRAVDAFGEPHLLDMIDKRVLQVRRRESRVLYILPRLTDRVGGGRVSRFTPSGDGNAA